MKRTKIVATVSDNKCDVEFLQQLYDAGMNVVRINTAHQQIEGSVKLVENTRKVSDKIALLVDTKGPELRTTMAPEPISLTTGDKIILKGSVTEKSTKECIYVCYNGFVNDTPLNAKVLIDDGDIELVVLEKKDNSLLCEVLNNGTFKGRKSINVPNVRYNLPSLNEKDLEYVTFAIDNNLDFIAHSFVRTKEDLMDIQKLLDARNSKIKIIAKIENQEGVDNIDEILDHCYGVMVARGDLAIEVPYERIPIVQKLLIAKCIERRKPVIVATQMLHTMIKNPRPTRAEVTDIATAIYSHADAIMLSGETAFGDYPVEAVKTMAKVAEEVENNNILLIDTESRVMSTEVSAFLTKSAVTAAVTLNAKAIVADTYTGRTVRNIASYRGIKPIYAQCYDKSVMRELALSYGVFADFRPERETSLDFVNDTMTALVQEKKITSDDLVVVVAGNFGRHSGASFIEISTVNNLQKQVKQ